MVEAVPDLNVPDTGALARINCPAYVPLRHEPAPGPTSRVVPWPPSGYPTRHVRPVASVVFPEPAFEPGLFNPEKVSRVYKEEGHHPAKQGPRAEKKRFGNQHQENPGDHRVAHVAIRSGNHQFSWRVPRRGSSFAPVNKQPGRPACQKDAGRNEQNGDPEPGFRRSRKGPGRGFADRKPEYGARDEKERSPRKNDEPYRESHVGQRRRETVVIDARPATVSR